jgi:hypothetical protein
MATQRQTRAGEQSCLAKTKTNTLDSDRLLTKAFPPIDPSQVQTNLRNLEFAPAKSLLTASGKFRQYAGIGNLLRIVLSMYTETLP